MGLTEIIDTWYNADGSLFNGTLKITPLPTVSGAIVYADKQSISQQTIIVQIQNGTVNFGLQANDLAQPSGTTYSVYVYAGRQLFWTETWTVPTSTAPVSLAAVRGWAQSLRRAIFFTSALSWLFPANVYGTSTDIPLVLLYDQNGNQIFGTIQRNLTTGDTTAEFAVAQQGVAEIVLTPNQYQLPIAAVSSVTVTAQQAALTNIVGIVVVGSDGIYVVEGVNIVFALIAASPAAAQASSGIGGMTPFLSNFSGAFQSVTISFATPQTGTIVLLGS